MNKKIYWVMDILKEKFSRKKYIEPKILLTKNRKDIEYRMQFLEDVIKKGKSSFQTMYYQFIADTDTGIVSDPKLISTNFLDLYYNIKKNGIKQPIPVGKYDEKEIKIRYILKGKKKWKIFVNESGYQALGGGHRLAIALFLNFKKIPVKIFRPSFLYEIPNYTDYLKLKEKDYEKNIDEH